MSRWDFGGEAPLRDARMPARTLVSDSRQLDRCAFNALRAGRRPGGLVLGGCVRFGSLALLARLRDLMCLPHRLVDPQLSTDGCCGRAECTVGVSYSELTSTHRTAPPDYATDRLARLRSGVGRKCDQESSTCLSMFLPACSSALA